MSRDKKRKTHKFVRTATADMTDIDDIENIDFNISEVDIPDVDI